MKKIGEKIRHRGSNAWGGNGDHWRQVYEIEKGDVGQRRENYLGQGYRAHVFTPGDVGKQIMVYSEGSWTCWTWEKLNAN